MTFLRGPTPDAGKPASERIADFQGYIAPHHVTMTRRRRKINATLGGFAKSRRIPGIPTAAFTARKGIAG
jgi:hypothetical protein